MSSVGQLKELLITLKESSFQTIMIVVLVMLVVVCLALVAYRRYLLNPDHDFTPPTEFTNKKGLREFE